MPGRCFSFIYHVFQLLSRRPWGEARKAGPTGFYSLDDKVVRLSPTRYHRGFPPFLRQPDLGDGPSAKVAIGSPSQVSGPSPLKPTAISEQMFGLLVRKWTDS